jgi:hypothetical protein
MGLQFQHTRPSIMRVAVPVDAEPAAEQVRLLEEHFEGRSSSVCLSSSVPREGLCVVALQRRQLALAQLRQAWGRSMERGFALEFADGREVRHDKARGRALALMCGR